MVKKAYKIETDIIRLQHLDASFDVQHEPFANDGQAISYWRRGTGEFPNPLYGYGDIKELIKNYDFPVFSLGINLISNKMLDALLSVNDFAYDTLQLTLIDESKKHACLGKVNKQLDGVQVNYDYFFFKPTEDIVVFDFEKSKYKRMPFDLSRPYDIDKLVFKEPSEGFPPVFRTSETSGLFISHEAKEVLDRKGVHGLFLKEVEVS
jgi:hypothetical protein